MIIDIHAHIWAHRLAQDKKELIKASERFGISKIYISCLGTENPDESEIALYNQSVQQFMMQRPELIAGYCYVNPRHACSLDTLRKGIERDGFSGMKLWIATLCDDPLVFPLVEQCIEYNVPILLHAFQKSVGQYPYESTGVHVARLAARYPQAKIIMAHLGGNCYHGVKAVRGYSNVWVDFSGTLFNRDELDYTNKQIGAGRMLFGSDMPGSFLVNQGLVEEAELTEDERARIYYRNALQLFDRQFKVGTERGGADDEN